MSDIRAFKREHELVPADGSGDGDDGSAAAGPDELDLRAEDDALVAAALEAEQDVEEEQEEEDEEEKEAEEGEPEAGEEDDQRRPRRRGRRGGRGRRRRPRVLEGTFDHGDEGYGLWLDPAIQDDPVYAEHWAGHRPVTVAVEPERIVISRAGEEAADDDEDEDDD